MIFAPMAGWIQASMQLGLVQILEAQLSALVANKEVCSHCGPSDVENDWSDPKLKNLPSKPKCRYCLPWPSQ